MTVAAGVIVGGGAGLLTLTNAFKPEIMFDNEPHKLDYKQVEDDWKYSPLDPAVTTELAYKYYTEGSCMYATVRVLFLSWSKELVNHINHFPFIYLNTGMVV